MVSPCFCPHPEACSIALFWVFREVRDQVSAIACEDSIAQQRGGGPNHRAAGRRGSGSGSLWLRLLLRLQLRLELQLQLLRSGCSY